MIKRSLYGLLSLLFMAIVLYPGGRLPSGTAAAKNDSASGKIPIVLVHGWLGIGLPTSCTPTDKTRTTEGDINNYFARLDDPGVLPGDRYVVFHAHLVSSACFTPPLVENIPHLMNAIDAAKSAAGSRQVIVIAHSMGGLVSRAYIEGPLYRSDVSSLYTFGSPHQGIPHDVVTMLLDGLSSGAACQDQQPAVCDFTQTGMQVFNRHFQPRAGVAYHYIGGDAPWYSRNALGLLTSQLFFGPNDGIISLESATATSLPRPGFRLQTDENHNFFGNSLVNWSYFDRRRTFPNPETESLSYTTCLSPALVGQPAQLCGRLGSAQTVSGPTPAAPPFPNIPSLTGRTPFQNGLLLPGQSVTLTLSIQAGPTVFATAWNSGQLSVHLLSPGGIKIDPAYAQDHPQDVFHLAGDFPLEGDAAVYYLPSAEPGAWKMVLQTLAVPAAGSRYLSFAALQSDISLTASTDRLWYPAGSIAVIQAALGNVPGAAEVTARIERADRGIDTVSLLPTGNGNYAGVYLVPDQPGYASVLVRAIGTGGAAFEREKGVFFQIAPARITLTGSYSAVRQPFGPGSPYFRSLDAQVGVNVTQPGRFMLSGDLLDSQGRFVAHAVTSSQLNTGLTNLVLVFSGSDIQLSGLSGPYRLTNLLLTDHTGPALVSAEAQNVLTTPAYAAFEFGPRRVLLPVIVRP